ncbi:Hsp70 family protein [Microvirga sp. M2]|uniref:Hsp70 family protein n=1 Tax=Microvirga sp. M2 TaxID=3073270 RepID=UPI0039C49318
MHLGIDLGTSNSAIFGNDKGTLRLFKTVEGADVLPSAILIDRRGNVHVGRKAYEQTAFSPENVAQGFKRLMGTSSTVHFPGPNRTMSPEEASAEVVKALLAQARMAAGEFPVEGAIITIPAAFNQMQSEATMRAAAAAGLDKVGLLQEPVAAAMASIAEASNKNGQFLVYDLGGGTFDVAIVQSVGGTVNVVAHAGINMLGGRDFDRVIVNSVVRPWLLEKFDLPENFQTDSTYNRMLRVAQFYSERAKIELSVQETARVFADENQIGARDRSGEDIYLDAELTRGHLEQLIVDEIDRSIALCRKLLADNGYQPGDVDRIVFIGGPSRMPIVRSRVPEQLGIAADLDTDPMTAVAKGAAIYAESRDWSGTASSAKSTRGSARAEGPVDIRFDYPARTSDSRIRIRIRPGASVGNGYRAQIDNAEGWTSGQVAVEGNTSVNDVPVPSRGDNRFRITVFDPNGSPVPEASIQFTVTRTDASAAGIPATQTVSVKIVDGAPGAEYNALCDLVKKGTLLPESGTQKFRSARDMRAGDGTHLDFELYQQEEGVRDPDLNLNIGAFRIDSEDLERGEVVRRGDEVICQWSMDDNGLLNCTLSLPAISREFNVGKFYVATAGHRNFDGEEGTRLASAVLDDAEADLENLREALGSRVQAEAAEIATHIDRQRANLESAWDADTRRSVAEEGRLIRQEIARIKTRPEHLGHSLAAEIRSFRGAYDTAVRPDADPKLNSQADRLFAHAQDAVARGTPEAIRDAQASLREAVALARADLYKRPEFIVSIFRDMAGDRHFAIDKDLHDRLVRKGEEAISQADIDGVRRAMSRMHDNMFRVGAAAQTSTLASLMRW